jgi:hypothetical protein
MREYILVPLEMPVDSLQIRELGVSHHFLAFNSQAGS